MQIITTKYGGFCFGVERAVDRAMAMRGNNNYVLGEIIHNEQVVEELEKNGVITVSDIEEVPDGATLLIRTHGESEYVFRRAAEKNLRVVDCTCPFVKDIQKIVKKHFDEGYAIVIIGNRNHPEVKGINGWCENKAFITDKCFDVGEISAKKVCIVVQTTFSMEKFDEILKNIPKDGPKTVEIFKTICYTTIKRQEEAESISAECDAVIVLGGKKSNNTDKLFEICAKHCKNVFRVSSPVELDYKEIKKFEKVGIVVGASTPSAQSREVVSNMENAEVKTSLGEEAVTEEVAAEETKEAAVENTAAEETAETVKAEPAETVTEEEKVTETVEPKAEPVAEDTMAAAIAMMDNKSQKFRLHQIITATISQAQDDGLALYIPNTKKEVLLEAKEMLCDEYKKEDYVGKVGDDIDVMVLSVNPLKLSERAMVELKKEEAEIEEIKNGKTFEVKVTGSNKGGLTGVVDGCRSYQVFVPSSQIRIGYVKDLDKYIGKTLKCKAEKVEGKGNRRQIVASQRVILEAEKAERDALRAEREEAFFNSIEVGDIVKGTTQRFADFGVFVNVNGFDCLAHISDLSWTGCKKCSDVLELNKMYEFKILKIDKENKKVSIGYKQLQPKPWELVADKYHAGDVVKGKVVRIVSFGAFVEVEKDVDGLVHVSQISNEWLENPTAALKVGDEVEAKILEIDTEKEKMTLSIKALLPDSDVKKVNPNRQRKAEEGNNEASKARKPRAPRDDDDSLREWKDDSNGGASIAEILANLNK